MLERDPDTIRVVPTDSLNALPAIAAHKLNTGIAELEYDVGSVSVKSDANQKFGWDQLSEIAHRKFHQLLPGLEPGLKTTLAM